MSKRSSLYASSRLRLRKAKSLALTKPTKKKSLSSSSRTVPYRSLKASGKGHFRKQQLKVPLRDPSRERPILALLKGVAKSLLEEALASLLKDLSSKEVVPLEVKPWQHEG
jgi:hypothetical protein